LHRDNSGNATLSHKTLQQSQQHMLDAECTKIVHYSTFLCASDSA